MVSAIVGGTRARVVQVFGARGLPAGRRLPTQAAAHHPETARPCSVELDRQRALGIGMEPEVRLPRSGHTGVVGTATEGQPSEAPTEPIEQVRVLRRRDAELLGVGIADGTGIRTGDRATSGFHGFHPVSVLTHV
jgi:hypothetical protein